MSNLLFFLLCYEGAILSFSVGATSAILPTLARYFSVDEFFIGRAVWLYMLPYGIVALLYGPLARVVNIRKIKIVCVLFFTLACFISGLSIKIYVFLSGRLLMGIFGAAFVPLILIIFSKSFEKNRRGRLIGIFFSVTFMSSLLGIFLSGFINWRWIYIIPGVGGALLFMLMIVKFPSFPGEKGERFVWKDYFNVFIYGKALRIIIYIFIVSMLFHSVRQWLSVYFDKEFGFSQALISSLITIISLSGIFGETGGGWLADRWGRLSVVNLGVILMIVSLIPLVLKGGLLWIVISLVLWGVGWTFNHVGVSAKLTELPKNLIYETASLNSSIRFLSGGLGMVLSRLVMEKSFSLGFLIIMVIFFLLLLGGRLFLREG